MVRKLYREVDIGLKLKEDVKPVNAEFTGFFLKKIDEIIGLRRKPNVRFHRPTDAYQFHSQVLPLSAEEA